MVEMCLAAGYGNSQNVEGNTNVTIGGNAYILQSVYGGGKSSITARNTVSGNSNVTIEGGQIDGSIYAGAQGISTVVGNGIITINNIDDNNIFAQTFEQNLFRGNRQGSANVIFDGYNAYFKGNIGDGTDNLLTGSFNKTTITDNSDVSLVGQKNYYSDVWQIEEGSRLSLLDYTVLQNYDATTQVINEGTISLNRQDANANTQLNILGSYLAQGANSNVEMYANTNTDKNYITISGNASFNTDSTQIQLDLDYNWDHTRIDLIEADQTSAKETFSMNPIKVNGGYAVLKYEQTSDRTIWYIEFQEDSSMIWIIIIVLILLILLIIIIIISCSNCCYCDCCYPCKNNCNKNKE